MEKLLFTAAALGRAAGPPCPGPDASDMLPSQFSAFPFSHPRVCKQPFSTESVSSNYQCGSLSEFVSFLCQRLKIGEWAWMEP